ncbi:hypothetical protein [Paenirhodobacter sp.]
MHSAIGLAFEQRRTLRALGVSARMLTGLLVFALLAGDAGVVPG